MNRLTITLTVIGLGVVLLGSPALAQHEHGTRVEKKQGEKREATEEDRDVDLLYQLVRQAREDLRELRKEAGLHPHGAGPHTDPEGSHANDSPEKARRERSESEGHSDGERGEGHEGRSERGEGRGEHGGRGEGGHEGRGEGRGEHGGRGERGEGMGEESGTRIPKMAKHDEVYRNGARLILQFNPNTQVFVGSVTNTTRKTLSQVRVEIHLSNGVELGPTKRVDLKPGATIPVELGAFGNEFTAWVTHPEAGVEAGHGPGGEEGGAGHEARERGEHGGRKGRSEGRGEHGGRAAAEHGEGGGARPRNLAYRPLYNQLQVLRGEMHAFKVDLKAKDKK